MAVLLKSNDCIVIHKSIKARIGKKAYIECVIIDDNVDQDSIKIYTSINKRKIECFHLLDVAKACFDQRKEPSLQVVNDNSKIVDLDYILYNINSNNVFFKDDNVLYNINEEPVIVKCIITHIDNSDLVSKLTNINKIFDDKCKIMVYDSFILSNGLLYVINVSFYDLNFYKSFLKTDNRDGLKLYFDSKFFKDTVFRQVEDLL